jgi:hypothetical protein
MMGMLTAPAASSHNWMHVISIDRRAATIEAMIMPIPFLAAWRKTQEASIVDTLDSVDVFGAPSCA